MPGTSLRPGGLSGRSLVARLETRVKRKTQDPRKRSGPGKSLFWSALTLDHSQRNGSRSSAVLDGESRLHHCLDITLARYESRCAPQSRPPAGNDSARCGQPRQCRGQSSAKEKPQVQMQHRHIPKPLQIRPAADANASARSFMPNCQPVWTCGNEKRTLPVAHTRSTLTG